MTAESSVYNISHGSGGASTGKAAKKPVMVVVDDRHHTITHARRRNRFLSSFFRSEGSGSFQDFESKLYKKAKRRNLWGNPNLGPRSVKMTCPNCRYPVDSVVVFQHTCRSAVAMICFTAVGLCCIPAMLRLWQDGLHYCPLCNAYLGHSRRTHMWRKNPPSWLFRNHLRP